MFYNWGLFDWFIAVFLVFVICPLWLAMMIRTAFMAYFNTVQSLFAKKDGKTHDKAR